MTINDTPVDLVLKSLLQKNIVFELDKKTFKKGRLIIYSQKYFYITLVLHTDKKKQEKLDIPIPFNIEIHKEDNLIYFDYRLSTLAHNDKDLIKSLQEGATTKNKFIDKILTISILE